MWLMEGANGRACKGAKTRQKRWENGGLHDGDDGNEAAAAAGATPAGLCEMTVEKAFSSAGVVGAGSPAAMAAEKARGPASMSLPGGIFAPILTLATSVGLALGATAAAARTRGAGERGSHFTAAHVNAPTLALVRARPRLLLHASVPAGLYVCGGTTALEDEEREDLAPHLEWDGAFPPARAARRAKSNYNRIVQLQFHPRLFITLWCVLRLAL